MHGFKGNLGDLRVIIRGLKGFKGILKFSSGIGMLGDFRNISGFNGFQWISGISKDSMGF